MTTSKTLSRTALARLAHVSPDTLRHYERKGVLPPPPRTANGYRRYPEQALARVLLIRRALTVGFTLEELSRVLRERDAGGAPCRKVHAIVRSRFADLEERLASLTALRDELRSVLAEWDARLEGTAPGRQARLLDALAGKQTIETLAGVSTDGARPRSKSRRRDLRNL